MSDSNGHWYTQAVTPRRVETSRGPVEYADVGEGLPVLYFHGTGAGYDAAVMMECWLLDDGFRLIVPNRPGYYGTPLSCGKTPNDCADLAAELLNKLHIERAAVIGTSGGGLAAPSFAARYPEKTAALVMQCALAHRFANSSWMPAHLRWLYLVFKYYRVCMPLLRFGYRREIRKLRRNPHTVLNSLCGTREPEVAAEEAAQTLASLLAEMELRCAEQPAGVENDWANAVGEPWLTPGSVSCPTLILHDRADPLIPGAHVEWVLNCIPAAIHCDLHAGGHAIWLGQDGDRMRRERTEFLRRQFL